MKPMPHLAFEEQPISKIIRIPCGIVNCYLVRQESTLVLVDTAFRRDGRRIERSLAALGVYPKDLRMVLLTHGHIDHAGSALYFRQRYQLPLAMNPLEDDTGRPFLGRGPGNRAIWALTRSAVRSRGPIAPDIPLRDGQSLQNMGLDAKVVALPGHTAGSMGLLLPGGRLLCGDLFSCLLPQSPAGVAEDSAALRESIGRLQEWKVRAVYPGHGKPFRWHGPASAPGTVPSHMIQKS